ncbi:MAG: nitroreductase family protein [Anaerolineae bacterium]|nr:nitroreductase family protein [Anaerolineae bacterium]
MDRDHLLDDATLVEVIERRFSCRTYLDRPVEVEKQRLLDAYMQARGGGPFGSVTRFRLIAAEGADREALRGLGTYGFIKGATGFILGAVAHGPKRLEDFGYSMELVVLYATQLGLGTCWLGGTFTKSRFAERLDLRQDEVMPCVIALGYVSEKRTLVDRMVRRGADGLHRYPWERLFFDGGFGTPVGREACGAYALPLEMVRRAPSASNKQPWRIVRDGAAWHFYLQRTPGYGQTTRALVSVDLQRVDMGIAMSHFQRTAEAHGLFGQWVVQEPGFEKPDEVTEYVVSWQAD